MGFELIRTVGFGTDEELQVGRSYVTCGSNRASAVQTADASQTERYHSVRVMSKSIVFIVGNRIRCLSQDWSS